MDDGNASQILLCPKGTYLIRASKVYCTAGLRPFVGRDFFPFLRADFLCVVIIPSQTLPGGDLQPFQGL